MGWPVALGLLIAGLLIGQLWARRSRGLWGLGSARPGLAAAALAALVAALVTGVRGLWVEALVLLAIAAALTGTARMAEPGRAIARGDLGLRRRALGVGEAASVLGVAADASTAEVDAAYRRLIRSVHPDQGGTAGLAAQLNAARGVMLARQTR